MPDYLLPALAVVLGAYFVRGIAGFGSGLLSVPLLALFMPLQTVVPLVLVLDFIASLIISRGAREHVQWDEVIALLPTTLVGIAAGVTLLVSLPKEPLLTALAVFILVFAVRYLFNIHGERRISKLWSLPAGFAGGGIGALFGTGGPPYIIYLAHRLTDKSALRATMSGIFTLDGGLRVVTYLITGLLGLDLLLPLLALLPAMLVALYAGHRVHVGLNDRQMLVLVGGLLLASGLALLIKVWW